MGTDIRGWVEVTGLEDEGWRAVVDAGELLDRNYDAFGCLFGVTSYANFDPVVSRCGLPPDASVQVLADAASYEVDPEWASWVTWSELRAVDWQEKSVHPDSRLHRYLRTADGGPVYEGKATWNRTFARHVWPDRVGESMLDPPCIYAEGQEWEIDGVFFRAETLRRDDAIGDDWRLLFRVMETLAEIRGDEAVRLVVWFDS